jgi:membrane-associated phospholipid phosphatase
MDLEAMAVANLVNNVLFWESGRARPLAAACAADPNYDTLCWIGANASFPSGHTVTVATAAGLTCVHHNYLPIYGARAADASACVAMSLLTVATGVTRIMADRHYATDVLVGAAIGYGSGYGLPWVLHYRSAGGPGSPEGGRRPGFALVPFANSATLGLTAVGLL